MLLAILLFRTRQVFAWLRVTRIVDHPSIPVAMVVVAGLVHAGFEDWLLAVGYHMSVVFWALALSLPDLAQLPARIATPVSVPATAAMGAASPLPRR
jgi:hypothetical protein